MICSVGYFHLLASRASVLALMEYVVGLNSLCFWEGVTVFHKKKPIYSFVINHTCGNMASHAWIIDT
jgi:hypothetical protein